MKLTLRPIVPADEQLLFLVYASTRAPALDQVPWNDAQKASFLRQQFEAQHLHYTMNYPGASLDVVLVDDVAAGRLYVHRGARELRIMDIALLPELRGKGIGQRLLAPLLAEADRTGCRASIHVEQQDPAMRLYERLGFRPTDAAGIYRLMLREPQGKTAP